jgi:hypothetical protein
MHKVILPPKRARGQSLVELALFLIILLWLLAGAVDFGIAYFTYVVMRDAAQEGALYGSINPSGDIVDRAISSTNTISITDVTVSSTGDCPGDELTVTVTYPYRITMPLTTIFTGPTITLRARSTSVILTSDDPGCSP